MRTYDTMTEILKQLWKVLTPRTRERLPWVLLAFAVTAVFEVIGVAAIFPFMMVLAKPGLVQQQPLLNRLYLLTGHPDPQTFLMFLGFAVLAALVLGNLSGFATTWLSLAYIGQERAALSALLLDRYLARRYAWFQTRNSAELGRNVVEEVASIPFGILLPLLRIFSRGLVVLLILLQLLLVDPLIAALTGIVLGGAYGLIWLYTRARLNALGLQRLKTEAMKYKIALEALNGIKTTIVLGRERTFLSRFAETSIRAADLQASQGILSESPRFLLETLAFGGVVLVILFLCARGDDVGYVLPIVSVFALSAYRLMPALQQSFAYLASIRGNIPALTLLSEDYAGDTASFRDLSPAPQLPLTKEIELKNVTLEYPGAPSPILKGLSLVIGRGTSIALVGSTGSGKTSLVDVLIGLIQPQQGQVIIDGCILSDENTRNWQANIGYVSQDVFLIDDTMAANIAFGVPEGEINPAQVEACAKAANLHDFISSEMTSGYGALVGERGVRLSGGQRQRVGIARALYTNPALLVLDEATSALDGLTERAVMEAIQNLSSEKTLVIIAHRLSTIRFCDKIYILENGRIVEEGDYGHLMKTSEKFQAMARGTESGGQANERSSCTELSS